MKKKFRKKEHYRKAKKSPLRKEYWNVPKIQGGCKYCWLCCFPDYGKPRGDNKKRIHRHWRRVEKQDMIENFNKDYTDIMELTGILPALLKG